LSARYLIRIDDVCPTMNWSAWSRVEAAMTCRGIKPIVAIIPDNHDPKLVVGPAREDFWSRVRIWQEMGWTIGWHGYQHRYVTSSGGLMGIHRGSEFAGVPTETQRRNLSAALEIFRRNEVSPQIWIAPGHSFDTTTVKLLGELGMRVISDGFYWRAVHSNDCIWIPQQLWRFRTMPFGIWTVCLHINSWSEPECADFEAALDRHSAALVSVDAVLKEPVPGRSVLDHVFSRLYRYMLVLKVARQARPSA
jgi:predicted deacetylase